jgi:hypothetical protein
MCDFEDIDIISKYTRQTAVDDGVLVQVLRWNGKPVMATTHLSDNLGAEVLLDIWHEFRDWKEREEAKLAEEDRLFNTVKKGQKIWVIEDGEAFTIMYPSDY